MSLRSHLITLLVILPFVGTAQAQPGATVRSAPVMNDAYQGGWRLPELQRSVDQWTQRTTAAPDDAIAHLNLFRSERNAALLRGKGRIEVESKARLQAMVRDLDAKAPDSFEAHLAHYHLDFPEPASFAHLERASRAGPGRTEIIGPLMVDAARRADARALDRQAQAMKAHGQLAPGLLTLANDILLSVDRDAVLIAAGEMDAFPLWVRQGADGQRRDVLVVDERLLSDAGYRSRVWAQAKAEGMAPMDRVAFITELAVSTKRPVFLSLALGAQKLAPFEDRLFITGIAARYSSEDIDNIGSLEQRWNELGKTTEAGPLSRNYLVPGSVLLKHYRAVGDEGNAARMEHELRRLAEQLGATDLMITNGIFEH